MLDRRHVERVAERVWEIPKTFRNDMRVPARLYRSPILWRSPRIFEDSPTCPKDPWSACPHGDCLLLEFVPKESAQQTVPCRHIPLNESGETLATLYNTATNEEIQQTLREWLLKRIAELEHVADARAPWLEKKAS